MPENFEVIGSILSYIVTAGVAAGTAILARRKAKEDTNLATIAEGIRTWKELAESNKSHWDSCEQHCEKLEQRVKEQDYEILTLKTEINLLKLQIRGRFNLDEENF